MLEIKHIISVYLNVIYDWFKWLGGVCRGLPCYAAMLYMVYHICNSSHYYIGSYLNSHTVILNSGSKQFLFVCPPTRLMLMHLSEWTLGAIPRHMTGVHLTIKGTLKTAILSDIILTLQIIETYIVVGGGGFW